ncbi:ileal sodium/bile acid cotransporter-like [Diadema antillarum]|uniref:ileal sodium/bile acid cotransporter-like n=1 Tax=Diadema antillarum TaxID=105358 RepID=UPI003A86A042
MVTLADATVTETNTEMSDQINITFDGLSALYTFEGAERSVNVTVFSYDGKTDVFIQFNATDERVFQIVNQSSTNMTISKVNDFPQHKTLHIRGIALGIEDLLVVARKVGGTDPVEVVERIAVKVNLQPKKIMVVVKYVMLVFVIIGFVNMGGTIDLGLVWNNLRRPWGVVIGMVCQFMIMPPLAFGLAKALKLDSPSAIGLVLDGSCPGGYLSNILSVMLDVDYVLSLTMTFCSNILAMGMMPLNLFIYTPPLTAGNKQLETPFTEIGLQLVLMFIPISIGIFFKYKSPRVNRICTKLLKPLSTVLLVLVLATSLPFQLFIFAAPTSTYIGAILLPLCGSLLGFLISKAACLPFKSTLTVALETGVQNALLATTIITFFYPHPEAEIASRAPYLIFLMTVCQGIVLVLGYMLVKKFLWKPREDEEAIVSKKDDGQAEKSQQAVTEMIKNGVIREVNENEIDVDIQKKKTELQCACQTDFGDLGVPNLAFVN